MADHHTESGIVCALGTMFEHVVGGQGGDTLLYMKRRSLK